MKKVEIEKKSASSNLQYLGKGRVMMMSRDLTLQKKQIINKMKTEHDEQDRPDNDQSKQGQYNNNIGKENYES